MAHGRRELLQRCPRGLLLFFPGGREFVILDPLAFVRGIPAGGDQLRPLEPVQRGIERSRFDLERLARGRADDLRDAVAVPRSPAQRLKNDQVERALEELDSGQSALWHGCSPSTWWMKTYYHYGGPSISRERVVV